MNGWGGPVAVAGFIAAALAATQIPKWRQAWRNARGVIDLTEREHTCETCSDPSGMGPCTGCPVFCGHRYCRGRRSSARWTPDDMAVLAGDLTSIKREGQW